MQWFKLGVCLSIAEFAVASHVQAQSPALSDAYANYIRQSNDFKEVHQEPEWALKAFPSWTYMPWTYQWNVGYNNESGSWSVANGYNGAFIDHGDVSDAQSPTGKLDWIERHGLRFYVDHAAGKGLLHLWDGNRVKPHMDELHGTGMRAFPINTETRSKLETLIKQNLENVKRSPQRAAYALDDEASWGHFVHPTMWQVTDDPAAYPKWLNEVYGPGNAPRREKWFSYEDIRTKLPTWSIAEFDASPLMDQWTFNDSLWCNMIGELVAYSNSIDPDTPCGLVGGQMPSPFGGYDYAKLMRKVQFIESYNLGSSQAIIRSLNRSNAIPTVTTHFHKSVDDSVWQTWYYLAHGNRGFIGWVENWFEGKKPQPWHEKVAPTFREAAQKIGPLMKGAQWEHDGIAIYYSHASIQLGWILDAQAHGKTWVNRNNDERLSSAAMVRHAWENMLHDSGLQYNFLSYVDVVQNGIPDEYRVLILPATLCLSDAEAEQIKAFCKRGGTVIADYMPGLWDQHGKGRSNGGAIDEIFGTRQNSNLRMSDVFGKKLWVEVDQDVNYSWSSYEEFLTRENTCVRDSSGFHIAVLDAPLAVSNRYGDGTGVLMNLSPQWYNAHRVAGFESAKKRQRFMQHIEAAGVKPRVQLVDADERTHGVEVIYWRLASGRKLCFVCLNPEIAGNSEGGGNAVSLKSDRIPIHLRFNTPMRHVLDERTGKELKDGTDFHLDWKQTEAVVLSMD